MSPRDIEGDARRVFDILRDGGIAIVYMDVAYAIMSRTDDALRRVYAAKGRPVDRASGVVGTLRAHDEIQVLGERERAMVRAVTVAHGLPMSCIAPFRAEHPYMQALSPFLREMATRDGTVNVLLNAGALRDRIAELAFAANIPLVASSANASSRGTKYRAEDIEPEVRAAADIVIDYGPSKYRPDPMPEIPLSSTQIDFRTMRVVRRGICFDAVARVLKEEFGVALV